MSTAADGPAAAAFGRTCATGKGEEPVKSSTSRSSPSSPLAAAVQSPGPGRLRMARLLLGAGPELTKGSLSGWLDTFMASCKARSSAGSSSVASWLAVPNTKSCLATWRMALVGERRSGLRGSSFFLAGFGFALDGLFTAFALLVAPLLAVVDSPAEGSRPSNARTCSRMPVGASCSSG